MSIIALDSETTTRYNASPYAQGNEDGLVCWSYAVEGQSGAEKWNPNTRQQLRANVLASHLVVGANFKFDLHWFEKNGVDFSNVRIWDVLVAQFIIDRQRHKFPSLNYCAERYGIAQKLDVVKTQYWEKGVDTADIPWDVLSEYAAHDAAVTLAVYHKQLEVMTPAQIQLCKLQCQDLYVLFEMERNGLTYDEELCNNKAKELGEEIEGIHKQLSKNYPGVPINFGSPQQLSAILYGGKITEVVKEQVGVFKSGAKIGQPRYKNSEVVYELPRIFTPLDGTELEKEGQYKTSEDVLRKLKGGGPEGKRLIEQLLRLSKLDKLVGTYYKGLPTLNKEMNWKPGKLHGTLNQTLAYTGRLTSSKPNQQNIAEEVQQIFISEFK